MQDFDWVKARSACSPFGVFTKLRVQLESDVAARNAVREERKESNMVSFFLDSAPDRLLVRREGNNVSASVEFRWTQTGIAVRNDHSAVILEGILTLNDDAECRLRVGRDELTFWQFRRRALEDLFFSP